LILVLIFFNAPVPFLLQVESILPSPYFDLLLATLKTVTGQSGDVV
jgi:hypothetical protein